MEVVAMGPGMWGGAMRGCAPGADLRTERLKKKKKHYAPIEGRELGEWCSGVAVTRLGRAHSILQRPGID